MSRKANSVTVYTDGSCLSTKKAKKSPHGGWAALIDDEVLVSGILNKVSAMDCEILAIQNALEYIEQRVTLGTLIQPVRVITIYSDCDSVVQAFNRRHTHKRNKPTYTMKTFKALCDFVDDMQGYEVKMKWVQRDSTKQNKIVDLMARQERELSMFLERQKAAMDSFRSEVGFTPDIVQFHMH